MDTSRNACLKLAAVGCTVVAALVAGSSAHGTTSTPAGSMLVVKLKAKGGSGVTGTATLTPAGKKIRVVIKLARSVPGSLPAHLHIGLCSIELNVNIREGLNNVVKGTSVTVTSTAWATLRRGRHSIHVHKSGYVPALIACGDVPRQS